MLDGTILVEMYSLISMRKFNNSVFWFTIYNTHRSVSLGHKTHICSFTYILLRMHVVFELFHKAHQGVVLVHMHTITVIFINVIQ